MNQSLSLEALIAAESPRALCLQTWGGKLVQMGLTCDSFRRRSYDTDLLQGLQEEGIPRLVARDIIGSIRDALDRSNTPMAILWDLDRHLIGLTPPTQQSAESDSLFTEKQQKEQFNHIMFNMLHYEEDSSLYRSLIARFQGVPCIADLLGLTDDDLDSLEFEDEDACGILVKHPVRIEDTHKIKVLQAFEYWSQHQRNPISDWRTLGVSEWEAFCNGPNCRTFLAERARRLLSRNLFEYASKIQDVCNYYGNIHTFYAYCRRPEALTSSSRCSLLLAGCRVEDCPTASPSSTSLLETKMSIDAMKFAYKMRADGKDCTVCLVMDNGMDFVYLLNALRECGCRTMVVAPTVDESGVLPACCDFPIAWTSLLQNHLISDQSRNQVFSTDISSDSDRRNQTNRKLDHTSVEAAYDLDTFQQKADLMSAFSGLLLSEEIQSNNSTEITTPRRAMDLQSSYGQGVSPTGCSELPWYDNLDTQNGSIFADFCQSDDVQINHHPPKLDDQNSYEEVRRQSYTLQEMDMVSNDIEGAKNDMSIGHLVQSTVVDHLESHESGENQGGNNPDDHPPGFAPPNQRNETESNGNMSPGAPPGLISSRDFVRLWEAIEDASSGSDGSSVTKAAIFSILRRVEYSSRFPSIDSVGECIQNAISSGILEENGEGTKKMLRLAKRYTLFTSDKVPGSARHLSSTFCEAAESLRWLLLIPTKAVPLQPSLALMVQPASAIKLASDIRWTVFGFGSREDALVSLFEHEWIHRGTLLDWQMATKESELQANISGDNTLSQSASALTEANRDANQYPPTKNLHVSGFGRNTTTDEIHNLFSKYVTVLSVIAPKPNFMFVKTAEVKGAVKARLRLSGVMVNGSPLFIQFQRRGNS